MRVSFDAGGLATCAATGQEALVVGWLSSWAGTWLLVGWGCELMVHLSASVASQQWVGACLMQLLVGICPAVTRMVFKPLRCFDLWRACQAMHSHRKPQHTTRNTQHSQLKRETPHLAIIRPCSLSGRAEFRLIGGASCQPRRRVPTGANKAAIPWLCVRV